VAARLIHVSDLHFGRHESPEAQRGLAELVAKLEPELVIASGDLTHRGRRDQHERAAAFLGSLGAPLLAVPGNHDVPYTFPARFTRPWAEFERRWETAEPVFRSERLHVVGVNSVRPWRHQSGGLAGGRLERAAARLREAAPGTLRVAVLHHHLLGAPWRAARKRPVAGRGRILAELAAAGAELVVGGHIHQATAAERREFLVVEDGAGAVVVTTAPGFGRPRPGRSGEAQGAQVYEATADLLRVVTYVWRGSSFAPVAAREFPRGAAR
jgi:3',5'-cyclic AMP phosphodiesterase CpdA